MQYHIGRVKMVFWTFGNILSILLMIKVENVIMKDAK